MSCVCVLCPVSSVLCHVSCVLSPVSCACPGGECFAHPPSTSGSAPSLFCKSNRTVPEETHMIRIVHRHKEKLQRCLQTLWCEALSSVFSRFLQEMMRRTLLCVQQIAGEAPVTSRAKYGARHFLTGEYFLRTLIDFNDS